MTQIVNLTPHEHAFVSAIDDAKELYESIISEMEKCICQLEQLEVGHEAQEYALKIKDHLLDFEVECKLRAFLHELSALTRKYGVTIGGCGCCGSPYLYVDGHISGVIADNLAWDEVNQRYRIEKEASANIQSSTTS